MSRNNLNLLIGTGGVVPVIGVNTLANNSNLNCFVEGEHLT
jgi:hypothetical protein